MYLVQVFTIPIVGKGWKVFGLANHIGSWAAFIVGIVVTVGVAHTLYLIFERPTTDFLRRIAAQQSKRKSI
jgi:peptidoglycan/LPS O-acetylase OafA/YrhL